MSKMFLSFVYETKSVNVYRSICMSIDLYAPDVPKLQPLHCLKYLIDLPDLPSKIDEYRLRLNNKCLDLESCDLFFHV